MTINLLAVSTAKNTNNILHKICEMYPTEISLNLHLGDANSDFKASSMVRMNQRKAKKGHLMIGDQYSKIDHQLLASKDFSQNLETLIDQLYRHGSAYRYKSHNLQNLQDYLDYYHILADVLFNKIKNENISHVLFFNIPHLAYDTIIYQLAQSLKIDITIVTQSLFPNKFFSMPSIDSFGAYKKSYLNTSSKEKKLQKVDLFYMKKIKQVPEVGGKLNLRSMLQFFLYLIFKKKMKAFNPFFIYSTLKRISKIYGDFPKWRDPFAQFFHENELAYFEHLAEFEKTEADLSKQFVYFPLAMQPEMTTSAIGGRFRDQILAIEALARFLPQGIKIYVKENPKQGAFARGPLFFHRLKRIQSVEFMPSFANTSKLTQKAIFVATITGTVGWEALCNSKRVLVFGKAWYQSFPGVIKYEPGITYDEILKVKPDKVNLTKVSNLLLNECHDGIVDRAYINQVKNYSKNDNDELVAKQIFGIINRSERFTFSHSHKPLRKK